jgi:tetratricopeptide (TPR) repeat protein
MAVRSAPPTGDLSACLDAAIEAAQSPTRRIRLHLAAATRAAHRDEYPAAEAHWRAALALDPLNLTARAALGRRLDAAQDWDGLAALIRAEWAALPEADARRELAWLRTIELKVRQNSPRAALDLLLENEPTAWSLRSSVRRLADALGDDQALAAALEQPSASAMQTRVDALERAGVALDLGEVDQAIGALDGVLHDAPADILAAWVRAHLAMGQGDGAHALRLIRQQLAAAPTSGLARVHAHRLTAQLPLVDGRALMAEHAASDADAAWYMLCDAASNDDGPAVVQRLRELAGLVGDRAAEALLLEAGERADRLGLPVAERMRIWQLLRAERPERATQALLTLYEQADDVEGQVECLQHFAEQQAGPMQAAALWRAGLMLEDSLPHEASSLYWQAIEAWPDDPMALLLTLRVGEAGAPMTDSERAQQLEAIAARLVHDGRAARLLAAAAGTREAAGETAEAERDWLHAAMRYPERDALAHKALALLGDADEARIALLEARARRVTHPSVRAATRQRLAQEYIDTRGDRAAAADLFAEIVADQPDDLEIRRTYARLLVGLGRHVDAVEQYRRAAQIAAEPSERVALYTRIGELLGRHVGDLDGAIKALRQAIGLVDPTGGAQEVLAEVYLRAGQGHRALLAYQRLERMVSDPARRAQAQAGQVRALLADERETDAKERLGGFLKESPFEPLLVSLAQSLNVAIPEPEEPASPEQTNGIDLAELDRLTAALDQTRSRQTEAEAEVARASASVWRLRV